MKIYRVGITKNMLGKMPEKDRVLFILFGTMLNEINMLHKVTYLFHKKEVSEVERKAQIAEHLFFQTLLVGKLWECWQCLQSSFFRTRASKEYENRLNQEGKDSLEYLKRYFGKDSWIPKVRKWFSFHYDRQQVANQLEQMPEDEALEIFLSHAQGNSLYFASSMLFIRGIATAIDAEDATRGFKTYMSETLEVAGKAIVFLNEMLSEIAKEYLDLQYEEQDIPDPPGMGEIYLPFFISRYAQEPEE